MTDEIKLAELRRVNPAFVQAEAEVTASREDPTGQQERLKRKLARQREEARLADKIAAEERQEEMRDNAQFGVGA